MSGPQRDPRRQPPPFPPRVIRDSREAPLPPELEAIVRAAQALEHDHLKLLQKYDSLYKQHLTEQKRFRLLAAQLFREVEYLRQVHPLKGVLAAKQAELTRVKKSLTQIAPSHPDRKRAEQLVKSHVVERDEIIDLLRATEERLLSQLAKIEDAMDGKRAMQEMGLSDSDAEEELSELSSLDHE